MVTAVISACVLKLVNFCVRAKSLQSCLTLWNWLDYSPPDFSVHGILQARILEWVAMPSSRGSSWPRDRTHISYFSCIGRWVLYHSESNIFSLLCFIISRKVKTQLKCQKKKIAQWHFNSSCIMKSQSQLLLQGSSPDPMCCYQRGYWARSKTVSNIATAQLLD